MKERKLGILGKKLGMTQIFTEKGDMIGVTVVEVGPCRVLACKTVAKDGYNALQLGFESKSSKRINKAMAGSLQSAGGVEAACKFVKELRVSEQVVSKYKPGDAISLADLGWEAGTFLDATGQSKGKGFQGVMKRHHFAGFRATHGTHEYFRHGGSIGCRKWPGRVFKNRKMPGHMGDERVTTQNLAIAAVRPADNVVLIEGSVPGCRNSFVVLRPAIKHYPNA